MARNAARSTGTTGSAAKKAPAGKSAAKKTAANKSAAKKAPAKDAAAKAAAKEPRTNDAGSSTPPASDRGTDVRPTASQMAMQAAAQLLDLTGKEAEGVVGLEKTEDGWKVAVEVLELRRVPSTTDVLATYEVMVDGDGNLTGYRRLRRYVRGTPGED